MSSGLPLLSATLQPRRFRVIPPFSDPGFSSWTPVRQRHMANDQNASTALEKTACLTLCLQPPAKNQHFVRGSRSFVSGIRGQIPKPGRGKQGGADTNLGEVFEPFVTSQRVRRMGSPLGISPKGCSYSSRAENADVDVRRGVLTQILCFGVLQTAQEPISSQIVC